MVALAAGSTAKPIPVEFWHTGDDGLSQKLAYEVERTLERSADFTMRNERSPDTLVVRIPTNVDWSKEGQRTKVLYTVEFSSGDNRKISDYKGSCWEDNMPRCAAQIVKEAKIAARKIHVSP
jgi:hypothetical protein